MEQKEHRIKMWVAWALIISALCVDLAELAITWIGSIAIILGVVLSQLLSIMAGTAFWIIFLMLGVSMSSNTKRFAVGMISFIGEMIPGLDAIPFLSWLWTIGMIFTVVITRMEDGGEKFSIKGVMNHSMSFVNPIAKVASKLNYGEYTDTEPPLEGPRFAPRMQVNSSNGDKFAEREKVSGTNNNTLDLKNRNREKNVNNGGTMNGMLGESQPRISYKNAI